MSEIKTLPFCPFPLEMAKKISKPFMGYGVSVGKAFPYLHIQLEQSGINANEREYASIMFFMSFFYFIFFFFIFGMLFYRLIGPDKLANGLVLAAGVSAILSFLVFIQLSMYPLIITKKKVRDLEKNLVFALRTMLVQIKSGVSLFNSLNMIATGSYGALSVEFGKAVNEINSGITEQTALEKIATKNPSPFLRKSLWQIVNGMRAGADVSDVLKETVSSMTKQQSIEITKYGSSLRLLSLMYMMIGVIIPALGVTFLMVLASFPQIIINETVFWILFVSVVVFQFMFLGLIKSQRPNLLSL